jgi:hypothetical protein
MAPGVDVANHFVGIVDGHQPEVPRQRLDDAGAEVLGARREPLEGDDRLQDDGV